MPGHRTLCAHKNCFRAGRHGLGWGCGTGLVLWFCAEHLVVELVRLDGLLRAARRRAA